MAVLKMYDSTKIMSSNSFKACPFCGNDCLEFTNEDKYNELCAEHSYGSMLSIKCEKCHTEKNLFDIPDNNYWLGLGILISEWNRRSNDGN